MTKRFIRFQLPLVLWAALVFVSSSIPSDQFPIVEIPGSDKAVHLIIYFIFCALTHRALVFQTRYPILSSNSLPLSVAASILYGASDELHQLLVPGREASLLDLSADALGALAFAFWYKGREWLRKGQTNTSN